MSRKDPPVTLPDTDDPYILLDVRPGASADQIRRAYLRRVKIFKPDRHPAQFRRVREAYDRLREQEAWFDAWRQANEVVRQAQQARARADDSDETTPESSASEPEPSSPDDGDPPLTSGAAREDVPADEPTSPAPERPSESAARGSASADTPDTSEDAPESDEPPAVTADADSTPPDASRLDPVAGEFVIDSSELDPTDEPSDEALRAEAQQDQDDDDPSIEEILAALRAEQGAPLPTHAPEGLRTLADAVHEDLLAEDYRAAVARMLGPEVRSWVGEPKFSSLLLEVCCAVVWAAPSRYDELVARYGDLVAALDTEFRGGALLHRRTLTDELSAWREAVADWPQLHRFVLLGSSLRAPDEAELGLHLGRRAADDPSGLLAVLCRAAAAAPGIVALYVGMAERWSARYGRPLRHTGNLPTVADAAVALSKTAVTHRRVRWEQTRPVLIAVVLGAILASTSSPWVELVVIGLMLVLFAWRAWASAPQERIYALVLRPAAASWLWATGATPDEIAVAFAQQLPRPGTWAAVLHPGDLSDYPHLLGNDLILLAFGVTAPMIPQLGSR